MNQPILEARSITKVFAGRRGNSEPGATAVDDVSFALAPGGSTAIVGESGSGKTTLARILCGLETATGGEVLLEGTRRGRARAKRDRIRAAQQIQMVFQDPYSSLDPRQTGLACLDEALRAHTGHSSSQRRGAALAIGEQVGLGEQELRGTPRRLSGGQRQRLAIARALAVEPSVLVLDEAVSALDVSVQAQILNLLVDLRRNEGLSYVFVSHDLAVVRQISEHVIVMRKGRVVEAGVTADVLTNPQAPYTRLLRESVPRRGWRPQRSLELLGEPAADAPDQGSL
jgi:ABC-type glutathione transport system ATPase component